MKDRAFVYLQDTDDDDDNDSKKRRHKSQKRRKKLSSRRRSNGAEVDAASEDDEAVVGVDGGKRKKSAKTGGKVKPAAVAEPEPEAEPDTSREPEYIQIYSGISQSYDARNLDPATTYVFRVCAINSAGTSEWSPTKEVTTPAAPPAQVTGLTVGHLSEILNSVAT